MHRFFLPIEAFQGDGVNFPHEQAHQIRNVLRMRPGQRVVALDNQGGQYEVTLKQVDRRVVAGQIVAKQIATNEPGVRITLCQGLMKGAKFEWVLQKGTELGVSRFLPVVTQRSIVRKPAMIAKKKMTRWRRIIREATEQSRRGRIPQLSPVVTLGAALEEAAEASLTLIPWEQASQVSLAAAIPNPRPDSVVLFIGPEGGFTEEEVARGRQYGAIPVTLGPRILRSETAAIVSVALVLHQLQELG